MKIIEQFIKGKKNNEALCEDGLFVNENYIAVADGVTAKSGRLFGGVSGGKKATEIVLGALEEMPFNFDASEATAFLTEKVRSLYEEAPDGSAAVSIIIFSKAKNEIWSVGDCQCLINGRLFSHEKKIDKVLSGIRSSILENAIENGAETSELLLRDIGREFILPVLKEQHIFANASGEFSYGIINGTPVPEDKIIIHKASSGDEIVLSSDGYFHLFPTLRESEAHLGEVLRDNPLCIGEYPSTKGLQKDCVSFDDRTYIRFKV